MLLAVRLNLSGVPERLLPGDDDAISELDMATCIVKGGYIRFLGTVVWETLFKSKLRHNQVSCCSLRGDGQDRSSGQVLAA